MTSPTSTAVAVSVDLPKSDALMAPAQRALASAKLFVIDSPALYEEAGHDLRAIRKRIDDLDGLRKSLVKPFQDAVANANAVFKGPIDVLKEAGSVLGDTMLTYQREQERKAEEERQAAAAAAQRERERLQAEAAAAQAKADAEAAELRRQAEAAAAAGKVAQAARLESRADSREQAGTVAAAAATMQAQAVVAAAVPMSAPVPSARGISTTKRWTATVTDKLALIRYIAEHPEYQHWLEPVGEALRQFATATRGAAKFPGVVIQQTESLAVRKRA